MNQARSQPCYHCGLPVADADEFKTTLDGHSQSFCCPGCQAVAQAIHGSGLASFYQFRSELNLKPDTETQKLNFEAYDLPQLQQEFVHSVDPNTDDTVQAQFLIEGITCAACVWLIEHRLQTLDGIERVNVNAATERLSLRWQKDKIRLSEILSAVFDIGYKLTPANEDQAQSKRQKENRLSLMRLGVAGFGMMQVGMVAVALYTGASEQWLVYWRWVSLIIATPVVLFSARPFFDAAWRALKQRHLVMDVPVSIAIGFAYAASIWATLTASGEVYFDSVSMFTFFLLLGRYLEMKARHTNSLGNAKFAQLLPLTATLIGASEGRQTRTTVAQKSLKVGNVVAVGTGESIPCDGVIEDGESFVDESLLTGESTPVRKVFGQQVVAGSVNTESPLQIKVTAVGQQTRLSAIERLVESASLNKPYQIALADRLASFFVGAVLLFSVIIGGFWLWHEPSEALWIVLSVLVVTCPCALSLATPAAHAAALSRLRNAGLLVLNSDCLAALAKVDYIAFDKTGTLTVGKPQVIDYVGLATLSKAEGLAIIAALESGSSHPIAAAFLAWEGKVFAKNIKNTIGGGVSGVIGSKQYRFGKVNFALPETTLSVPSNGQWLLLVCESEPVAWVKLDDKLRDSAKPSIEMLSRHQIGVELISGDASDTVEKMSAAIGIQHYRAGCLPDEKLVVIQQYQSQGKVVMMVGDGINDVPVLSGANVSVAMSQATDLAQTKADCILLNADLTILYKAIVFAKRLKSTITQNLTWALAYNGLALPLAAFGFIPPWAAAIGMSLSSLIVVINALRLSRSALIEA